MLLKTFLIRILLIFLVFIFSGQAIAKLGVNSIPNLDPKFERLLGSNYDGVMDPVGDFANIFKYGKVLNAMKWCNNYPTDCKSYKDWDEDLRLMFLQYLYIYDHYCPVKN